MTMPDTPAMEEKRATVDRWDAIEQRVKLGAIVATLALVIVLMAQNVSLLGNIDRLSRSDEVQACTLSALSLFAAGVGEAFNTPPAPNPGRSGAVNAIEKSVPQLRAAARGRCTPASTPPSTSTTSPSTSRSPTTSRP